MSVRSEVQVEFDLGTKGDAVLDQAGLALLIAASESIPTGIALYGPDNSLVFVNDRFRDDAGQPAAWLDAGFVERLSSAKGAQPFQKEETSADGRSIRLTIRALPAGGFVATTEDITAQRLAEARILHVSLHDNLTGLGNRGLLQRRFQEARGRRRFEALLHIDLDEFKPVNAHYGYAVGDALLRAAAVRITDNLRDTDFVARFGGDEFVVLLACTDRHDGLDHVALRLIRALSKPFAIGDHDIEIGASIGSARFGGEGLDLDVMLKRAGEALRQAKAFGRGRHVAFDRREAVRAAG